MPFDTAVNKNGVYLNVNGKFLEQFFDILNISTPESLPQLTD